MQHIGNTERDLLSHLVHPAAGSLDTPYRADAHLVSCENPLGGLFYNFPEQLLPLIHLLQIIVLGSHWDPGMSVCRGRSELLKKEKGNLKLT